MTIPDDEFISIESEGNARYAVVEMDDGAVFKERIPLHVFKLPPEQQSFLFLEIAERLYAKTRAHRVRRVVARQKAKPAPQIDFERSALTLRVMGFHLYRETLEWIARTISRFKTRLLNPFTTAGGARTTPSTPTSPSVTSGDGVASLQ